MRRRGGFGNRAIRGFASRLRRFFESLPKANVTLNLAIASSTGTIFFSLDPDDRETTGGVAIANVFAVSLMNIALECLDALTEVILEEGQNPGRLIRATKGLSSVALGGGGGVVNLYVNIKDLSSGSLDGLTVDEKRTWGIGTFLILIASLYFLGRSCHLWAAKKNARLDLHQLVAAEIEDRLDAGRGITEHQSFPLRSLAIRRALFQLEMEAQNSARTLEGLFDAAANLGSFLQILVAPPTGLSSIGVPALAGTFVFNCLCVGGRSVRAVFTDGAPERVRFAVATNGNRLELDYDANNQLMEVVWASNSIPAVGNASSQTGLGQRYVLEMPIPLTLQPQNLVNTEGQLTRCPICETPLYSHPQGVQGKCMRCDIEWR